MPAPVTNLSVTRFLELFELREDKRPELSHPDLLMIPPSLSAKESQQLQDSLQIDSKNDIACATSAKLWEDLLENHPDEVYFQLLVADLRYALRRPILAFQLYKKLAENEKLQLNPEFWEWIENTEGRVEDDINKSSVRYLQVTTGSEKLKIYEEGQEWKQHAAKDSFPTCKLSEKDIEGLKKRWSQLNSEGIKTKYLNSFSVQTDVIDGTFPFVYQPSEMTKLAQIGFYNQAMDGTIERQTKGELHDSAIANLRSMRSAMEDIFSFISSESKAVDMKFIIDLHAKVLRSRRIVPYNPLSPNQEAGFTYTSINCTRQESCENVHIMLPNGLKVQFCPWTDVNDELTEFCERFNLLMEMVRIGEMDPFAAAAWISHVFLSIHPFDDGNGRISRLLGSIPVVMKGLPPICVGEASRLRYYETLREAYTLLFNLWNHTHAKLIGIDKSYAQQL